MRKLLIGMMIFFNSLSISVAVEENIYPAGDLKQLEKATFAGGCFWCMEPVFERLKGVIDVVSGYTGGQTENPTYGEVTSGKTGHCEAVEISFDPSQISYEKLLDVFWKSINPTTINRQFFDKGTQYRTAIFYHNDEQNRSAEESKKALAESGRFDKPIVTEIVSASTFYPAEEYHQDYYKKNPVRYNSYHFGSGREKFFEKIWVKERKK